MKTPDTRKPILFFCMLCVSFSSAAQQPYKGNVTVNFGQNTQNRETVNLQADIDLTGAIIGTNDILLFTPVLRSLDGTEKIMFETISVSGKKRAKYIQRQQCFDGRQSGSSENFRITTKRNPALSIPLNINIPFSKWMLHAQMVIIEQTAGCADCLRHYADNNDFKLYVDNPLFFPEPYQPQYTAVYLPAPKVEVKIMQETYSAQLNFHVNQTNLVHNFGNNARILSEADEIINRVKTDSLLTIRRIIVRGYASPEGNAANNQRLSEGRAKAFVNYLHTRHNIDLNNQSIIAEGMGEDWDGLRKAVQTAAYLNDREKVLNILENTPNTEQRKNALKALSAGRTYKMLLSDLYPQLRRNEYTIEYQVRGFNAEEARVIFSTRPQLLSLEEMFMVANLYEHNSHEYKQVFDVAARLFPESPISQFNVGAMEIENGSYDTAIKRFENITTPEALNNLGVAFWHKAEYDRSRTYFERAIEAGSTEAKENLAEFEKWLETSD